MSDSANDLSTETGVSTDLTHKGLGAILSFLKQHLGEDTFERIQAAIPDASNFLNRFESSPESANGGGLLGSLTGLAARFLGGEPARRASCWNRSASWASSPSRSRPSCPRPSNSSSLTCPLT